MNYLQGFIVTGAGTLTEACHLQSSTAYVPVLMNGFCLTASFCFLHWWLLMEKVIELLDCRVLNQRNCTRIDQLMKYILYIIYTKLYIFLKQKSFSLNL